MGIKRPFYRCYRGDKRPNDKRMNNGYIEDLEYAEEPIHYLNAYLLIQKDLLTLFEYVHPSDKNLQSFSLRIHELLMRTCIEIEANFKAILKSNSYNANNRWDIKDYRLVNITHHLDDYVIIIPSWRGDFKRVKPFIEWKDAQHKGGPSWYKAYNKSKHNRHEEFEVANLENLVYAVTGLLVLIVSQFKDCSFEGSRNAHLTATFNKGNKGFWGLGNYFVIEYPNNWSEEEMYDFDWSELKNEPERFDKIDYNAIVSQYKK